MPSLGSVITAAVAGNESSRRLRAYIAQATCPKLVNMFATAESGRFPPPLEMAGAKERVVREALSDPLPSIGTIDKFQTTQNDTVLIIGQVCFKFFNTDCNALLDGINKSTVYVMGGTLEDDFNISTDGIELMEENGCTVNTTPSTECPMYSFEEQWKPLLSKYDRIAYNMHKVAVAAFLTSRTDGAFYRQFGLATLAGTQGTGKSIMNFESSLARKVSESTFFLEAFKRLKKADELTDSMNAIIKHCNTYDSPSYGGEKKGGKEPVYDHLYQLWNKTLNATEYPALMPPLTDLILETVVQVRSPGAREYDGYTTAKMLYTNAGAGELTADRHYNDLMNLFDNPSVCAPEWIKGLTAILEKGDLYVYHDAGLDPFVDDYIALKILNAARVELDNVELDKLAMLDHLSDKARSTQFSRRGGRRLKRRKKTKRKKRKSKKGGKRKGGKTKKRRR